MMQIQVQYGLHNNLKPTHRHIVKIISQNTQREKNQEERCERGKRRKIRGKEKDMKG